MDSSKNFQIGKIQSKFVILEVFRNVYSQEAILKMFYSNRAGRKTLISNWKMIIRNLQISRIIKHSRDLKFIQPNS